MPTQPTDSSTPSFLLFNGGPFFELRQRLRLTGTEPRNLVWQIALAVLITWLPLVVLAAAQGVAYGPSARESVLLDIAMYARFLLALPILIFAPAVCGPRLRMIVQHFLHAELVKESERERFFENIATSMRLRDSHLAEIVILALAYLLTVFFITLVAPTMPASWTTMGPEGYRSLSAAGWWFVAVSQPVYLFLLLRLLYRVTLWWGFLWKTSRLELELRASHPDGAGGLAFLGLTLSPFALPVIAIAAALAGGLANHVLWVGGSVVTYTYSILAFVVLMVAFFVCPLLFFVGELAETKRNGMLSYGALSGRQLRQLEGKWLGAKLPANADLLGVPDFSAAIDLSSTASGPQRMRVLPFQWSEALPLVGGALLPFVPVAALEIPLKEILRQLLKILM